MKYDHLIVGGGIAGASAALEIRRLNAVCSIAIIGEEGHPVYSRVLLPHVADHRATKERAVLKTKADFAAKDIEYVSGVAARRIDAVAKTVTFSDGRTINYVKLLIATGATSRKFAGPGAQHCLAFRTLEDLDAFERATVADRVLVFGGGFNAIDLVASFVRRGVTVVGAMRGDGYLSRIIDPRASGMISGELKKHGVEIRPRTQLVAVEREGDRKFAAFFADGSKEIFGAIAVSIGVVPNVALLNGNALGVNVGAVTDEKLRISGGNGDIFAAGDVAEYLDVHCNSHRIAGNWQNGMFQGKTAGANMTGMDSRFEMVTSYSIPCFSLPVNVTGAVDVAADRRIVRPSLGGASLHFVMVDDRVVGASCIGPFPERVALGKLISSQKTLSVADATALADGNVPLDAFLS